MKYTFEYMFIPQMVENGDFAFPNYHDFDDMQSLEDAFEDSGLAGDESFPWDELSIVKFISRECTYWLFRFPKPERQPEAVYGMVVQRTFDSPVYYILEMGMEDNYFFCKMDEGQHVNLKMIEGLCTEEAFKEMVLEDFRNADEGLDDDLLLELDD